MELSIPVPVPELIKVDPTNPCLVAIQVNFALTILLSNVIFK